MPTQRLLRNTFIVGLVLFAFAHICPDTSADDARQQWLDNWEKHKAEQAAKREAAEAARTAAQKKDQPAAKKGKKKKGKKGQAAKKGPKIDGVGESRKYVLNGRLDLAGGTVYSFVPDDKQLPGLSLWAVNLGSNGKQGKVNLKEFVDKRVKLTFMGTLNDRSRKSEDGRPVVRMEKVKVSDCELLEEPGK